MVCVYCGYNTRVVNSRLQKKANSVWRRRKCQSCSSVFTSLESLDTATSLSVRKLNDLEPFSRDKLLMSVYDSLRHRKDALEAATALCGTIMSRVHQNIDNATIKRNDIVSAVSDVLERFDHAAAVHYKAFHPLRAEGQEQ